MLAWQELSKYRVFLTLISRLSKIQIVTLVITMFTVFSISYAQQCAFVSSGLWLSALIIIAFMLILLMVYYISSLEIIASIFDRNQIRAIVNELLGETGLNLLIVFFFTALYFNFAGSGTNTFMGLANALPSAFSQQFINDHFPAFSQGPFVQQSQLYMASSSPYLMTDRPLYLQAAKYYVYFMRSISLVLMITLNFINAIITLLASISIHFRIKLIGFSISFGNALNPILHAIAVLLQSANVAVGHWILQGFVLDFIECYSLELLLPLGIVLRLFPFTKPFGNIVIAVVIGLLIVYPMMLNLNAVHAKMVYGDSNRELTLESVLGSNIAYILRNVIAIYILHLSFHGMMTFISPQADTFYNNTIKPILQNRSFSFIANVLGEAIGGLMALFIIYFNMYTMIYLSSLIFNVIFQETLFLVVVMSLIWPAINIYVTLLSVKAFAKFLGTDFNLAAIARLL
ncbi:MAG: hypothetical protein N3E37_04115 [Candidatus Micrarchaeota archaeon]|nr:hypothetical protein [Candidatus Micrarchaeota archaeon]